MKRLVVLLASLGLTPLWADYVLDFSVANPDNGNKKDTRVITDVQITTKEFTLEAWVRRNSNQAGFKIFAQYPGQTYKLFLGAQDSQQTTLDVFLSGATNPSWWQPGITIPQGKWTHVAMTKRQDDDGVNGTVKLFVNGALVATKTEASLRDYSPSTNRSQLWLGNTYSDGNGNPGTYQNGFPGYMAEMRFWRVCRTDDEVAQHYNHRLVGNETGLAGYWPLNAAFGKIAENKVTGDQTAILGAGTFRDDPDLRLPQVIELASGSQTVSENLEVGDGGLLLLPHADAHLTLSGVLSGTGMVTLNNVGTGGEATLSGDNAHSGGTTVTRGRLNFADPDALGTGTVEIQRGTLKYTGTDAATVPNAVCIKPLAGRNAILQNVGDLTLTGTLSVPSSGGFVKRGAGTLTIDSDANLSGLQDQYNGRLAFPANGDAPTEAAACFSIAEGTVVIPAGRTVKVPRFYVGKATTTAAGAETAGHLIVRGNLLMGGDARNGTILLGPSNGGTTTAPTPLHSSITVDGGSLAGSWIHMAGNPNNGASGFNAEPVFTISSGTVTLSTRLQLAENGGKATFNANGGTLETAAITKGAGKSYINFNGGLVKLTAAQTFYGFTELKALAGGVKLESAHDLTLAQAIGTDGTDGGLEKTGTGRLIVTANQSYAGATTVTEGELALGADLAGAGLSLNDGTVIAFQASGASAFSPRTVGGALTVGSGVTVRVLDAAGASTFAVNGTYELLSYSGADPDVSGMTVANPAEGKTYTLTATGGRLMVKVGTDIGSMPVWNLDANGAFATAANWTTPPAAGDIVRFDDRITAPRTVTVAGEQVGGMYLANLNAYTFAGSGLAFGGEDGTFINVQNGEHRFEAPVTASAPLSIMLGATGGVWFDSLDASAVTLSGSGGALGLLNTLDQAFALAEDPVVKTANGQQKSLTGVLSGEGSLTKAAGGKVKLEGANTFTGGLKVFGGSLVFANPSALGAGTVTLNKGTLAFDGTSATVTQNLATSNTDEDNAVIRADGDVTFTGNVQLDHGGVVKTGPGTVTFSNPSRTDMKIGKLGQTGKIDAGGLLDISADGDAPTVGSAGLAVAEGTVVFDGGKYQVLDGRILVGRRTSDTGPEKAAKLVVESGELYCDNNVFGIGWNNGSSETDPDGVQSELVLNGGKITGGVVVLGNRYGDLGKVQSGTYNARPKMTVNGGEFLCRNVGLSMGQFAGTHATFEMNGGIVKFPQVEINQVSDASSEIVLNGGVLDINDEGLPSRQTSARIYRPGSGACTITVSGGTIRSTIPLVVDTRCDMQIGAKGVTFDCVSATTNKSALLTAVTDGVDGGFTKTGPAAYVETKANTVSGPFRILAGTFVGVPACSNDLLVAQGASVIAENENLALGALDCGGSIDAASVNVAGSLAVTNAFTVTGSFTLAKAAVIDFGRTTENPVVQYERVLIGHAGSCGRTGLQYVVNTGLAQETNRRAMIEFEDGNVYATVVPAFGTVLILK